MDHQYCGRIILLQYRINAARAAGLPTGEMLNEVKQRGRAVQQNPRTIAPPTYVGGAWLVTGN